MARCTNLTIDLESTSKCLMVECLEELFVLPGVFCCVKTDRALVGAVENAVVLFDANPSSAGVMADADRPNW